MCENWKLASRFYVTLPCDGVLRYLLLFGFASCGGRCVYLGGVLLGHVIAVC